jgi:hypothetical protein
MNKNSGKKKRKNGTCVVLLRKLGRAIDEELCVVGCDDLISYEDVVRVAKHLAKASKGEEALVRVFTDLARFEEEEFARFCAEQECKKQSAFEPSVRQSEI